MLPVFACGSSIAGTVSFLEEAEFNEVTMVPSSDQLTVGKVGPALRLGWTRIILCMAGGTGCSTSHMSAYVKYFFRYRGRATSIHCLFLMKAIVSTVTTEECETRQPSELGTCTIPLFLMYNFFSLSLYLFPLKCFLPFFF